MNRSLKKGSRRNPRPQQIEEDLFNHIIWSLGAFYLIVSKGPIHWDFPIGQVGGIEMIRSSCRVNHAVQIRDRSSKNKASTLFPIQRPALSLCFHIENSLQMKRCQRASYFQTDLLHLYITLVYQEYARKALRIVDSSPEMA
uniref:Uncharacterized protein n=1 Tax=Salix viminalis TaxID=40686 RepID=A0A6N2KYE3_SALVM